MVTSIGARTGSLTGRRSLTMSIRGLDDCGGVPVSEAYLYLRRSMPQRAGGAPGAEVGSMGPSISRDSSRARPNLRSVEASLSWALPQNRACAKMGALPLFSGEPMTATTSRGIGPEIDVVALPPPAMRAANQRKSTRRRDGDSVMKTVCRLW
jgi:hypothetical protein